MKFKISAGDIFGILTSLIPSNEHKLQISEFILAKKKNSVFQIKLYKFICQRSDKLPINREILTKQYIHFDSSQYLSLVNRILRVLSKNCDTATYSSAHKKRYCAVSSSHYARSCF